MRKFRTDIILRVLCILLASVMLFGLVSCKKKRFSDPTEQFVAALNDVADEAVENSKKAQTDKTPSLDITSFKDKKVSATIQPVLSDTLGAMLGEELPFDISVFNNIKLGMEASSKGELAKLGLSLGYGNSPLIALSGILDIKNLGAYINISEGTDKALFFDLKSIVEQLDKAELEQVKNSLEIPADGVKELIPIISEYFKLIYCDAKDVVKVENTVAVGSLSAEMTVLTWTASDDEFRDKLIEICEKFVADERIKPLLEKFYQGVEDWDEAYAEIVDSVKEFIEDEKNDPTETTGKDMLTVRLYVDKENDIQGIDILLNDVYGYEVLNFASCALTVEDEFAVDMSATVEDSPMISLSASGTDIKDVVNCTMTVSYDGKQAAVLTLKDCDNSKADKGIFKGSVHLKPGSGLASIPDIDPSTAIAIGMFGLKIDFDNQANKSDMFISVEMNNANLAGIKLTVENGEAEAITVPTNYVTDPETWAIGIDFNKILTALDNSELPDEIVNMIISLLSE